MILNLAITLILSSGAAMAHQGNSDCEHNLLGNVRFIESGRENSAFEYFSKVAEEYLRPGGIFEQLGVSVPKQVLQFMPGSDVNAVGQINGFAVSHWTDGQKLSRGRNQGLLYEIVISGMYEHFGMYRDDLTFEELLSIFFHATAGHNHFSHNSRFPHFRSSDRIQEAWELSSLMDQLRLKVGAEEVSRWYQYLLTLSNAQDFVNARYQTPDELVVKPSSGNILAIERASPPFEPTRNILQALAANLRPDTPEWKREMALRFERLHRFAPGLVRTKIMNEGYATLMQFILVKHGSHKSFENGIHYCCLLSGVASKSLSNPYWLGLEAWRNIYSRFLNRPDIKSLRTDLEKDREFIKHAKVNIIGVMDDAMFLQHGLDRNWVVKENLALVRPLTEEEWFERRMKGDLMPVWPPQKDKEWPYAITTRDPDQIIKSLVTQQKGLQYSFPVPELESFSHVESGAIYLNMSDVVGRRVALDRQSLIETLVVLARITQRPVTIESTFDIKFDRSINWLDEDDEFDQFFLFENDRNSSQAQDRVKKRIAVTAAPNGHLEVQEVFRQDSSAPESMPTSHADYDSKKHTPSYKDNPELKEELAKYAEGFDYNLNIGAEEPGPLVAQMQATVNHLDATIEGIISGVPVSLQIGMPTAAKALNEYRNFLEKRIGLILRDAINGRGQLRRRPNGVQVRAMPTIPWLRFDSESLESEMNSAPKLPIPRADLLRLGQQTSISNPGDFDLILPTPGRVGDTDWGPNPKKGKGEGPGDQPGGNDPSDEGGERAFEEVSLDDYAQALEEEIQLPNLRPKPGLDMNKDEDIAGQRQRLTGMPVNRAILRNAYRRGFDPEKPEDSVDAIRRGMGKIRKETEWIVRDFAPKKSPDTNAVVFFQMDMSGSMMFFKNTAKKIIFDLKAILKYRYKKITFVFITFNDQAWVFDNEEEFFKFSPNGGTRYARSFEKVIELYEQFPEAQWDRFPVVVGDLDESFGPEEKSSFEEMKDGAQYTAIVRTHYRERSGWDQLADFFRDQSLNDEYVGYVDVVPPESYMPLIFKQLFKNE